MLLSVGPLPDPPTISYIFLVTFLLLLRTKLQIRIYNN